MPTLLIVDDDPNVVYSLEKSLQDELHVITASLGRQGVELVRSSRPDAVIVDVRLPDMSGLEVFDEIRQLDPRLPVVVVTAFATTETAIEAMKRGAFEYLLKPVDLEQLREVVARAIETSRLRHVPAVLDQEPADDRNADRIVGRSAAMQEVYKAIGRIATLNVNVLIVGESGTGKELVARAIYSYGARSRAPFLAINCAAIPEALLESELFGHEKGAFTGAERRRIGKFEQAHRGTLFLDEIGEMNLPTQAKLLRVLQEQQFERLGGNDLVKTDVRVVAATNQNMEAAVAAGRFRQDLYYRLKSYTINLPRLQDRLGDLTLLIDHFIKRFSRELGKFVRSASPEFIELLRQHSWPGNVRELENVVRHAVIHSPDEVLRPNALPPDFLASRPNAIPLPGTPFDLTRLTAELLQSGQDHVYRRIGLEVDRIVLDLALKQAGGSQVIASDLLGISRNTLRAKLRALGLAVQKQLLSDS